MIRKLVRASLLVGFVLQSSCDKESVAKKQEEAPAPTATDALTLTPAAAANTKVGIHQVGPAGIEQALVFQGDVGAIPEKLGAIVARLDGLVTAIKKKEGDKVKRGEAMVTIESKKLAEAKLTYLESEHRLEFAKEALQREGKLMEKRISSKEQYQKVVHEQQEAELEHGAALQRLRLLGFSERKLHELEENPNQQMTSYTLQAPFAGEVIGKDVTLGEAVMEDKTLFKLADLSELQVEIKVPLKSVPLFEKGAQVNVVCDATELEAKGTVSYIASMAEVGTRTVPVRVTIANPKGLWRPGMPARVEMKKAVVKADVAVPVAAIHEIAGKTSVFVNTAGTTYRVRQVTLGEKDERLQAVTAGLQPGERVAVENSLTLKAEWLKRAGE